MGAEDEVGAGASVPFAPAAHPTASVARTPPPRASTAGPFDGTRGTLASKASTSVSVGAPEVGTPGAMGVTARSVELVERGLNCRHVSSSIVIPGKLAGVWRVNWLQKFSVLV